LDEKIDDSVYIANGKDASAFIPDITEKGYAIMAFQNMQAGMECGVLISFDTVYGVKTFRTTYTIPTEAPEIPETPETGDEEEGAEQASLMLAPRIVKGIVPYYGEIKHEYTARQAQSLR
jgi:hypothetical protein